MREGGVAEDRQRHPQDAVDLLRERPYRGLRGRCDAPQLQRPTNISLLAGLAMTGANEKPNPTRPRHLRPRSCRHRQEQALLHAAGGEHPAARGSSRPSTAAAGASPLGPAGPFTQPNATGNSGGCVAVDGALPREMAIANPGGFYSNIHSTEFPGGAIRAPLAIVS